MIFNSPVLFMAGSFFLVERRGKPLFHIPDNVHPGKSGYPIFLQDTGIDLPGQGFASGHEGYDKSR
jgi:hypothetical protein